jgi:indolepyruvate ferredoxin oxidoreductase beta subunit
MGYQDAIRVAAQKTRAARYAEIRREVRAGADDLVYPVEFMHPRLEEICDILPRPIGARILASPRLAAWLQRFFAAGRMHLTYSLRGFLQLATLAALRPLRRGTLRFAVEHARIRDWLARIAAAAPHSPELALEIARCQRLIKGYGDTHARGWRSFSRIMDFVADAPVNGQTAATVARLHAAALADEAGAALERELAVCRAG